jgi:hypothetical protein
VTVQGRVGERGTVGEGRAVEVPGAVDFRLDFGLPPTVQVGAR